MKDKNNKILLKNVLTKKLVGKKNFKGETYDDSFVEEIIKLKWTLNKGYLEAEFKLSNDKNNKQNYKKKKSILKLNKIIGLEIVCLKVHLPFLEYSIENKANKINKDNRFISIYVRIKLEELNHLAQTDVEEKIEFNKIYEQFCQSIMEEDCVKIIHYSDILRNLNVLLPLFERYLLGIYRLKAFMKLFDQLIHSNVIFSAILGEKIGAYCRPFLGYILFEVLSLNRVLQQLNGNQSQYQTPISFGVGFNLEEEMKNIKAHESSFEELKMLFVQQDYNFMRLIEYYNNINNITFIKGFNISEWMEDIEVQKLYCENLLTFSPESNYLKSRLACLIEYKTACSKNTIDDYRNFFLKIQEGLKNKNLPINSEEVLIYHLPLVELYFAEKDFDIARTIYKTLMPTPFIQSRLARIDFFQGKFHDAKQRIEIILACNTNNFNDLKERHICQYLLARIYHMEGSYQDAVKLYIDSGLPKTYFQDEDAARLFCALVSANQLSNKILAGCLEFIFSRPKFNLNSITLVVDLLGVPSTVDSMLYKFYIRVLEHYLKSQSPQLTVLSIIEKELLLVICESILQCSDLNNVDCNHIELTLNKHLKLELGDSILDERVAACFVKLAQAYYQLKSYEKSLELFDDVFESFPHFLKDTSIFPCFFSLVDQSNELLNAHLSLLVFALQKGTVLKSALLLNSSHKLKVLFKELAVELIKNGKNENNLDENALVIFCASISDFFLFKADDQSNQIQDGLILNSLFIELVQAVKINPEWNFSSSQKQGLINFCQFIEDNGFQSVGCYVNLCELYLKLDSISPAVQMVGKILALNADYSIFSFHGATTDFYNDVLTLLNKKEDKWLCYTKILYNKKYQDTKSFEVFLKISLEIKKLPPHSLKKLLLEHFINKDKLEQLFDLLEEYEEQNLSDTNKLKESLVKELQEKEREKKDFKKLQWASKILLNLIEKSQRRKAKAHFYFQAIFILLELYKNNDESGRKQIIENYFTAIIEKTKKNPSLLINFTKIYKTKIKQNSINPVSFSFKLCFEYIEILKKIPENLEIKLFWIQKAINKLSKKISMIDIDNLISYSLQLNFLNEAVQLCKHISLDNKNNQNDFSIQTLLINHIYNLPKKDRIVDLEVIEAFETICQNILRNLQNNTQKQCDLIWKIFHFFPNLITQIPWNKHTIAQIFGAELLQMEPYKKIFYLLETKALNSSDILCAQLTAYYFAEDKNQEMHFELIKEIIHQLNDKNNAQTLQDIFEYIIVQLEIYTNPKFLELIQFLASEKRELALEKSFWIILKKNPLAYQLYLPSLTSISNKTSFHKQLVKILCEQKQFEVAITYIETHVPKCSDFYEVLFNLLMNLQSDDKDLLIRAFGLFLNKLEKSIDLKKLEHLIEHPCFVQFNETIFNDIQCDLLFLKIQLKLSDRSKDSSIDNMIETFLKIIQLNHEHPKIVPQLKEFAKYPNFCINLCKKLLNQGEEERALIQNLLKFLNDNSSAKKHLIQIKKMLLKEECEEKKSIENKVFTASNKSSLPFFKESIQIHISEPKIDVLEEGKIAFNNKNYTKAFELFTKIIESKDYAYYAQAYFYIARMYFSHSENADMKKYEYYFKAMQWHQSELNQFPLNTEQLNHIQVSRWINKDLDIVFNIGENFLKVEKKFNKALLYFEKLLNSNYRPALTHFYYGLCMLEIGDQIKAIKAFKSAQEWNQSAETDKLQKEQFEFVLKWCTVGNHHFSQQEEDQHDIPNYRSTSKDNLNPHIFYPSEEEHSFIPSKMDNDMFKKLFGNFENTKQLEEIRKFNLWGNY